MINVITRRNHLLTSIDLPQSKNRELYLFKYLKQRLINSLVAVNNSNKCNVYGESQ